MDYNDICRRIDRWHVHFVAQHLCIDVNLVVGVLVHTQMSWI